MMENINIQYLAWYSYGHWSLFEIFECFQPKTEYEKDYWSGKFDSDILYFFCSLDDNNKIRFVRYLKKKFDLLYAEE